MEDKFKKYQKLKEDQEKREALEQDSLDSIKDEVDTMLETFRNDEGETMVTYKTLKEQPFGVWFDVGKGVKFIRIKHPTKEVLYLTEMTPEYNPNNLKTEASFGLQEHDCKELVRIIEGELIEPREFGKRYTKRDKVIYPPYFKHKPKSRVFSRYEVEFLKPTLKKNNKT